MSGPRLIFAVTLVLIVVLGLVQCTPDTTSDTQTDAQSEAVKDPLKFAVLGPYTGDAASYGDMAKRGIQLAAEEINTAGGMDGHTIRLEFFDTRCDAKEAANVAQKVVADGTFFAVLGPVCSSATLATMPIFEEAGVTVLVASSSNPKVTQMGWKHIFRTIISDDKNGPFQIELAVKELDATRLAVMYSQDDFGRGLQQTAAPTAQRLGAEIVAEESFVPGVDKDFSAQLTRIREADPDALLFFGYSTEGGMIARQSIAAGLEDIPLVLPGACQDQQFLDLAGDAADGALLQVTYDPYSTNPVTKAFNDKWFEKYNELPGEIQAYNYELLYIVQEAVEMGATKDNLPEFVAKVEYQGPSGMNKFDETGDQTEKRPMPITVENGQWKSYERKQ